MDGCVSKRKKIFIAKIGDVKSKKDRLKKPNRETSTIAVEEEDPKSEVGVVYLDSNRPHIRTRGEIAASKIKRRAIKFLNSKPKPYAKPYRILSKNSKKIVKRKPIIPKLMDNEETDSDDDNQSFLENPSLPTAAEPPIEIQDVVSISTQLLEPKEHVDVTDQCMLVDTLLYLSFSSSGR